MPALKSYNKLLKLGKSKPLLGAIFHGIAYLYIKTTTSDVDQDIGHYLKNKVSSLPPSDHNPGT